MTKRQVEALLKHSATWNDKCNAIARKEFTSEMLERQYGYEALSDAWEWYITGWAHARSQAQIALDNSL